MKENAKKTIAGSRLGFPDRETLEGGRGVVGKEKE